VPIWLVQRTLPRPDCVPQWETLAPAACRGSYLPMLSRLRISAMPIPVLHWMGFHGVCYDHIDRDPH
jgi:hypothetical protein